MLKQKSSVTPLQNGRLLIISSEFPPNVGGIGNHAYNLAKALSEEGFSVEVVADIIDVHDTELADFAAKENFNIHWIRRKRFVAHTYFERILKALSVASKSEKVICSGKFSLWIAALLKINNARILIFIPIAVFVYFYVVNQTGEKIVARYEQEGTSNRDVLVNIGFTIFSQHMIFGVGTGNFNTTILTEKLYSEESGAHNEYVRAAAEHGIIGIFFYWGFYLFLLFEILKRREPQKQYAIYFFALFCLIIVHNGLKIAVQPLVIMLVVATPTLIYHSKKHVYNREYSDRELA
jgi:glycosyltransferase involved in cell wall biosynthesis